MEGKKFIQRIRIENLFSYGSQDKLIDLEPLNILIGTNASGKSNLIEAIGLLRALSTDLSKPILKGGGINEWLWKGTDPYPTAKIEAIVDYPESPYSISLRYKICFTMSGQRFFLQDEVVENEVSTYPQKSDVYFFLRHLNGIPVLNVRTNLGESPGTEEGRSRRSLRKEDLNPEQSVLSQRKDPDQYPELTYLGNQFSKIKLYREWNLGRDTPPRRPQQTDMPGDFLLEDMSNLGLVINNLQTRPAIERTLLEKLQRFYPAIEKIDTKIDGGTVQLYFHEQGLHQPVPATRWSDGTLRYLCLLSILLHPSPPPLICLEEPELGLHPDVLPILAKLLIEASQRSQLIVTTHSDVFVSELTEIPECVMVCEHSKEGSHLTRLNKDNLKDWLDKYRLGEMWRMGELGGVL